MVVWWRGVGSQNHVSAEPARVVAVGAVGEHRMTIELTDQLSPRQIDFVLIKDEGATWIRGHHNPSSPSVRALLAANMLLWTADD